LTIPEFGLTQYLLGAVVFTLKATISFVGLRSLRMQAITGEKGGGINIFN
jgi:hypothetical protein